MTELRPNIIYILADDMGYGDMGCNNPDSKIPTPHMDHLASQGMRFTNAHAASSVCTPSRYSILTGRYCWRSQLKSSVLWDWDPPLIERNRLTVAGLLRQNGYRTGCIGKWHLGWEWATLDGESACKGTTSGGWDRETRYALGKNIDFSKPMRGGPVDNGFDTYFGVDVPNFPPYTWFEQDRIKDAPTEEKPDEMFGLSGPTKPGWKLEEMIPEFVRRAETYIEDSGPDPFFLYFSLTSPHTPIVPNKQFLGTSGAGSYGDFVCEVDWVVGRVMEALERKGIAENTLVIFTSDNGPESSAYECANQLGHYSMAQLRGIKRDTWEGGHRVPFIARWPQATPAESTCDQLITLGDLMATCAGLLGVELPKDAAEDSVNMLPLLQGDTQTVVRRSAVHHSCSGRFAIRKDDWVFIDAPSGDDNKEPDWFKKERGYTSHDHPGELFNLREDIAERKNLYAERPEVVQDMARLLADVKRGAHAESQSSKDVQCESE
jgi:arylsulfatase A